MGVGLIIIGVIFAGFIGTCAIIMHASSTTPEERAANDKVKAQAEAAEAKRLDDFKEAIRKGCKLSATAPVFALEDGDVRTRCQLLVQEGMTSPSSADFPNDSSVKLTSDDGCNRILVSSVEGLNAFGVKVRSRYACTFDPRTGNFSSKVH